MKKSPDSEHYTLKKEGLSLLEGLSEEDLIDIYYADTSAHFGKLSGVSSVTTRAEFVKMAMFHMDGNLQMKKWVSRYNVVNL